MRLFYFSNVITILLCFALWLVFQVIAAVLCLNLPDKVFRPDAFFFRSHRWEQNGRVYDKIFLVKRWKHLLPDGGAVWKKKGYQKKTLTDFSEQNLNRFLVESVRGECSHWLAILPFWVFGLFAPPEVIWIMLAYALAVNVPCIIAQRYNRPRILALMAHRKRSS